jgi:hypothetical protein
MPVTLPEDFPTLRRLARRPERLEAALGVFRGGLAEGSVRNKDYEEAKSLLGRAVEDAWRETVAAPFFHAGRWQAQSEEAQALESSGSPMSLHDLLAISKRLAKSSCQDPPVQAMRGLLAEVLPLAEASAALKGMVVKGRAPAAGPARAPNPDQERGTCSCCFRSIAVVPTGRMAHHGYERPGYGQQTSSCAGIRFRPLEVSTEGLEWLVWTVSERLGALRERHARRDEMTSLTYSVRERGRDVPRSISKGEPDWDRRFREWTRAIEFSIANTARHLEDAESRLADWRLRTPGRDVAAETEDPEEEIRFEG